MPQIDPYQCARSATILRAGGEAVIGEKLEKFDEVSRDPQAGQ